MAPPTWTTRTTPNTGERRLEFAIRSLYPGTASVVIRDSGPGIPLEVMGKIYGMYFTTKSGGSGIGLASTFRIVQLMNGSIDFSTEVGRGTTFRIELPLAA